MRYVYSRFILSEGIQAKNASVTTERSKLQDQLDHYVNRIASVNTELSRLQQGYLAGIFSLEEVTSKKREIDAGRAKLEQERVNSAHRLASLGISENDARQLLETVRTVKAKTERLTDDSKRKIVDLCDLAVTLYRIDGVPWMHIEANLTLQSDDIPIVSRVL